jgi:hypothetical protein
MQQTYIFEGEPVLSYETLYHQAKHLPSYQDLPRKVSQQVLKTLQKNWKGFLCSKMSVESPSREVPGTTATSKGQTTGTFLVGVYHSSSQPSRSQ